MDTKEAEGFFPEREVLRARRPKPMAEPVDPSEIRARRAGVWMVLMVAVFLPMIVNGTLFAGRVHITPRVAEGLRYTVLAVLYALAAGSLLAVVIRVSRWLKGGNAPDPADFAGLGNRRIR